MAIGAGMTSAKNNRVALESDPSGFGTNYSNQMILEIQATFIKKLGKYEKSKFFEIQITLIKNLNYTRKNYWALWPINRATD
jgi:hypothetical protein